MIPRASYRIQLRSHGVDFAEVERQLPWLQRLGISHIYLSPILEAMPGSLHGYDGIDPRHVDPALGGEAGLRALADACASRDMALLVDLVPNHLAAHPDNPFFADLLARGPASPYAAWFDVDWEAAAGHIVLPWLTEPLASAIARGGVRLEGCGPRARLHCGDLSLPLAEGTAPSGQRVRPAELERIVARQWYVLEPWRSARRRLNYRRFFDVNELIGVRAELPDVFSAFHACVLGLVRSGCIAGLRIDHVDGLADPAGYLRQLRRALDAAAPDALLVVEKILEHDEELPRSWPVDGTTGYEFIDDSEALFIDPEGARAIERAWSARVGARGGFRAAARSGRRRNLRDLLEADVRRVARRLASLRSLETAETMARALGAFLVEFDVYRVYPSDTGSLPDDARRRVERALESATRRRGDLARGLAALRDVLLPRQPTRDPERVAAARSVQQLAAAVAAKGVEDTAFYVYTPLLSRNEVGADPSRPLDGAVAEFHAANLERSTAWPRGMLAVSTHDTKRSADVRARLDVLSEIPEAWREAQARWQRWNAGLLGGRDARPVPDPRSELFLYQTLVGIWPLSRDRRVPSLAARRRLAERVEAYAVKAAREAKRETDWIRPDTHFEDGLTWFVRSLLLPPEGTRSPFLRDLTAFVREVGRPGLWNSLSRTVLQLGAPGVPDVYQGDALWRFDLVDPDNRRRVDFAARSERLEELEALDAQYAAPDQRERFLDSLVGRPEDGRLKLHVLRRGLAARAGAPALFTGGTYQPLPVRGERARHVTAYIRRDAGRFAVVAAPRLVRTLLRDPESPPVGGPVWGDTRLVLPDALADRAVRSALTGKRLRLERELRVARLFDPLPLALLVGGRRNGDV